MKKRNTGNFRVVLNCEQLEARLVLSNSGQVIEAPTEIAPLPPADLTRIQGVTAHASEKFSEFRAVIVAGDPIGSPPDSPANRVDPNSATSPFAGVGSLQITANRGTFICTGTPIDSTHVLSAAHCIDLNNDGVSDKKDGIRSITFNLNLDTDAGTDRVDVSIPAVSWQPHPDFTGFNRPSINDDLSVITLSSAVPAGVPTYGLATSDMVAGATELYLVGYGRSGDGVNGYTTNASFTVKRVGQNTVDAFYGQDDAGRSAANEVFRFDFDGPTCNGPLGGPTMGNDQETTLGGGDSGGPSFALCNGCDANLASSYSLVGVNTFTQGTNTPKFGSMGGGINVFPYLGWITGPHGTSTPSGGGSGGNGGGPPPGNSLGQASNSVVIIPPDHVTESPGLVQISASAQVEASSARTNELAEPTSPRASLEAPTSAEPVVVVYRNSPSSPGDHETAAAHHDIVTAIDAIIEQWLAQ